MEQLEPSTPRTNPTDTTTAAVSPVTKQTPTHTPTTNTTARPSPHLTPLIPLTHSEPSPTRCTDSTTLTTLNTSSTSNSVPSLRFPRPLGNRKLTNWVSSSSPDIMQPANMNYEDEVDLDELGYDIIGTDGESQAESTTSSTDYQGADDVQSLLGTDTGTDVDTNDVDTDSSDGEEVTLADHPHTLVQSISSTVPSTDAEALREEEEASVDTLAVQSLENPTSFEQYGLPNIHSSSTTSPQDLNEPVDRPQNDEREPLEEESDVEDDVVISPRYPPLLTRVVNTLVRLPQDFEYEADYSRRILPILLRQVLVVLVLVLISSCLSGPPAPRTLSTVPVAAVSSVAPTPVSDLSSTPTSSNTPVVVTTKTPNALQTSLSSDSFALKYLGGKETKEPADSYLTSQGPLCSVELLGNNEILIRVPETTKSSWLAQRAIMIAVSRGIYDIPTKLSSIEGGFLIQVPPQEAHGILDVYVATTRNPKVNEVFQINLSRHVFIEAFDAVKGFAQRVVDTVNVTTAWVEKNYSPAFDTMAKHICEGAASMASPRRLSAEEVDHALTFPMRMLSQAFKKLHPSMHRDVVTERVNQAHLELTRQAQDIRDELSLRLLTAQLTSKLWWLGVQGKKEEYIQYMANATAYYKQKQADALDARRERAARVKKEIKENHEQRKKEAHGSRSFFRMKPDWVI